MDNGLILCVRREDLIIIFTHQMASAVTTDGNEGGRRGEEELL